MDEPQYYDLIILGAGPAGMTAAVYAARKQVKQVILCQNVGGQANWSSGIENYLGYISITGPELVQKFEEHLNQFALDLRYANITKLSVAPGGYRVDTDSEGAFAAKAVIVATGKSPRLLGVPGEREFAGRGVTYCATCDGPLYAGKEVAVVGGGNSGLDAVLQLMRICPKVYLFESSDSLRADPMVQVRALAAPNVEVILSTAVREIRGDVLVREIVVEDQITGATREIDVQGVFVEVGLSPNTSFLGELLRLNEIGEIQVDCASQVELPGLFAAGDVTSVPEKQIIIAAGDGAKAALGAYSFLVRSPEVVDWGQSPPRRSASWEQVRTGVSASGTDELLGAVASRQDPTPKPQSLLDTRPDPESSSG